MSTTTDRWPHPPPGTDPLDNSRGIPHAELARRRAGCPVSVTASGAAFLARFDDVLAATRDVQTFQASFRSPGVVVPDECQLVSEIPEPRHGKVRRIINSAIAAHRIGRVEPWVRARCHDLLDGLLAERRPVDLVAEYVTPIPAAVIAHLLGAPPEHHDLFARWSDEVVQSSYATEHRTERGEGLTGASPEFVAYIDDMIATRAAAGPDAPDDFVTRLLRTEVDGQRLTPVEMRTQLAFLLISGNETTRHLIGNLLARLCTDAALWQALADDPGLVPVAVEESLRIDPPIHVLLRTCTRDTEVGGVDVTAGQKVGFGLASANRDEAHFAEPDRFALDRPDPRGHLAFGGGPHVCPGASLARLEGRVALEAFLARVASAAMPGDWRYETVPVFWANGPRTLPVELVAAPR